MTSDGGRSLPLLISDDMIRQDINIDKYGWHVVVYYEVTSVWKDQIMEDVMSIGIKGKDARTAARVTKKSDMNTGFTYSNLDEGESVVVVCNGSSAGQFFNSLIHELFHVMQHICDTKKIDVHGEEAAYLMGDLSCEVYPKIKHLLCGCGKHGHSDKDRPQ